MGTTFLIVIFILSAVALYVTTCYRAYLLRTGVITVDTIHKTQIYEKKVITQTAKFIAYRISRGLHSAFITISEFKIRTGARIARFFELHMPRVYAFFSKKPITPEEHQNSFFWRSVVEYKYKIKQLKAKIKEEERDK